MSDNVVYLTWENKEANRSEYGHLACACCKNKAYTIKTYLGKWPELYCTACGSRIGSFGWTEQETH